MMRRLLTGHAVTYNRRHNRQGHLFQNWYKSIVVEEESYFLELLRYIHLNPVRAGIVKSMEELAKHPYAGHSVMMGSRDYAAQNVEAVLARFSTRREAAIAKYERFVADGFAQGHRDDLRGGGLIRSAGELANPMSGPEDRGLFDARILGSGDFVSAVLQGRETGGKREISAEDILNDVVEKSGVSREQILGASRSREVSRARKQFYFEAHEKAGATKTVLGRLTGRSHVAVAAAIKELSAEREGKTSHEEVS